MSLFRTSQPRDALARAAFSAVAWGAGSVLVALLAIEGSSRGLVALPYPGALLLLAAVLPTYARGLGAGLVAVALTVLVTVPPAAPAPGGMAHGMHAGLVLALWQLVAVAMIELMRRRIADATRQQLNAEAAARESALAFQAEQTLRLVVDNIPQRVFWKDIEGRYLGCNTPFARDAGFDSPADLRGKTDFDLAWKEDAAAYRVDDAEVVNGGGAKIGFEEPQHLPDGSVLWLRTSKVPMLDCDGRIVGVLGTYEDTTEQRGREERLRIASNAQEFAHDAVVTLDLSHRIVSVNRAFSAITGYAADEVLGRDQSFLRSDRHSPEVYQQIWQTADSTGRWQGELWRRHKDGSRQLVQASVSTVRDDVGFATHYVMVFTDISKAREDADRVAYLAHHDALTSLANRGSFMAAVGSAVARSKRRPGCLAVFYIDLDGFKPVNDSQGHAAGDELLRQVASRLLGGVREADVVARLGGDEFAILMEEVPGSAECVALAEKLLGLLGAPYAMAASRIFVSASIGICLADPRTDAETLLKNADVAMYEAKRQGKGRYHVFSDNLDAQARRVLALTNQLPLAMEREELALAYQPKIAIRSGRIVAFEALMRWTHPQLGQVPPAEFIPIAEHTGLIDRMGDWALLTACRQASQWSQRVPGLVVCVNVSARQLRGEHFAHRLAEILRETGLNPGSLELEITESVIISEAEPAIDMLSRIRAMGVGLALDDFGTGYSSLSYLKRLPINAIKIDRSFVNDLPGNASDASLVRAIMALASSLGLRVVAEGVETREQLGFLGGVDCEMAQGYLISKPATPDEAAKLLGLRWSPQAVGFVREQEASPGPGDRPPAAAGELAPGGADPTGAAAGETTGAPGAGRT